MKYFKLIIIVLALIIFTLFFRTISADICGDGICTPETETNNNCYIDCNGSYYGNCSLNEYKYNGECIPYNNSAPYQITNKDMLVNPVIFGNIKVVGGDYVQLNETTNTTNLSIKKWTDESVSSSLDIFNIISDNDKNSFVIYLDPANITENYLEAYKFFFNLVYGSGLNENKNISLPFRLFK